MASEVAVTAVDVKVSSTGDAAAVDVEAAKAPQASGGFNISTNDLMCAADDDHDGKIDADVLNPKSKSKRVAEGAMDAFGLETKKTHNKHVLDLISHQLDKNGDGQITTEELVELIEKQVEKQNESKQLKKGLICAVVMVLILIVAVTLITVLTSFATTALWVTDDEAEPVGGGGKKRISGNLMTKWSGLENTQQAVATAAAEDVWEVSADATMYDTLNNVSAFEQTPKLITCFFDDSSMLQFPPLVVQHVPGVSAEVSNYAIGVTLTMQAGQMPRLTFHRGGSLNLKGAQPLASGPNAYDQQRAQAASPVSKCRFTQPDSVKVEELDPVVTSAGSSTDPLADDVAQRKDVGDLVKSVRNLIRVVQHGIGPASRQGVPNTWFLIGSTNVSCVHAVCERFEAKVDFEGRCGASISDPEADDRSFEERFDGNLTEALAESGNLPIATTLYNINRFREAMAKEGNPCKFTQAQQSVLIETAGGRPTPVDLDFAEELEADEDYEDFREGLGHDVRRLIASTPAGHSMTMEKAEEEHRRQLKELKTDEAREELSSSSHLDLSLG